MMALEIEVVHAGGRFAALLASETNNQEPHNVPLMEAPGWVIAPTLGAVVPNWVIAVPRKAALNLRSWREQTGSNPFEIVENVSARLGVQPESILWFEHGPKYVGSAVGCGTDYAHLHLILHPPFSIADLMDQIRNECSLSWKTASSAGAYDKLVDDESYLVVGQGEKAHFAMNVDQIGSQFLRRVISTVVGKPDHWNYHHYPQPTNIARTIETFKQLIHSARCSD